MDVAKVGIVAGWRRDVDIPVHVGRRAGVGVEAGNPTGVYRCGCVKDTVRLARGATGRRGERLGEGRSAGDFGQAGPLRRVVITVGDQERPGIDRRREPDRMKLERRRLEVHDIALVHGDLAAKEVRVADERPGKVVVVEMTDADGNGWTGRTGRNGQPQS